MLSWNTRPFGIIWKVTRATCRRLVSYQVTIAAVRRTECIAMSSEGKSLYPTNQELQAALIMVSMSFPGTLFLEIDYLGSCWINRSPEGCLINTDCISPFLFGRTFTIFLSTYEGFWLTLFLDYSSREALVLFNLLDLREEPSVTHVLWGFLRSPLTLKWLLDQC